MCIRDRFNNYLSELKLIPVKIEKALSYNSKVEEIAFTPDSRKLTISPLWKVFLFK